MFILGPDVELRLGLEELELGRRALAVCLCPVGSGVQASPLPRRTTSSSRLLFKINFGGFISRGCCFNDRARAG